MDINGIFSESFWYVAPILVAMTTTITGAINNKWTINGVWQQIIAWITASVLSVGAWVLDFVVMGDPVWVGVIALCIVVGLASNGFYDIPFIKNIIDQMGRKKI